MKTSILERAETRAYAERVHRVVATRRSSARMWALARASEARQEGREEVPPELSEVEAGWEAQEASRAWDDAGRSVEGYHAQRDALAELAWEEAGAAVA